MGMRFLCSLLAAVSLVAGGAALAQAPEQPPASGPQAEQQRQQTQPLNNAPVWRDVRSGQPAFTSIPGRETNVLVQSAGDTWRRIRNGPVTFYGGWLLVLAVLAMLGLYLLKGPVKLSEPPTGRLMSRFNAFEMTVHWTTAISLCLLGISGLIMFFGN